MPKTKAFKELTRNVRKTYLGKLVSPKYKKQYGKRYDSSEIDDISFAIAKSRGIKIH